ncbi:helix-turn-helix transcriptional regulator [Qipengyuania gelatinilytica]|uniref:AlpA family phage regulatory protein n=1 Tax=Qipengyuania gelatinilytica TaxID=2867231 RepID=A0ABX9A5A9_9SPHN|nr:AlpA family phage regulatory protein [Qipengyuania gelatinilytica]
MDRYLNIDELAELLTVGKSSLQALRSDESFPRPKRIGKRRLVWNAREIIEWVEAQ